MEGIRKLVRYDSEPAQGADDDEEVRQPWHAAATHNLNGAAATWSLNFCTAHKRQLFPCLMTIMAGSDLGDIRIYEVPKKTCRRQRSSYLYATI